MATTQVRIAGFGGQGVVLAGVLLGRAALEEGLHAIQNQSYGAEARGGAARSEVIVASEPIVYPEVTAPDILAALSQAGADRYLPDLRPGGTLIADAELVANLPALQDCRLLRASFTRVAAEELGRQIVANIVMLGFLVGATGLVGADSARRAVEQGVPRGTEELNLRALE
ncbi:MAG: 2-oxoacid:acceptor oxidoreductase family protein, partial [Candidatus Latescibacterota bacterium]